jgi:hypothetical protein
MVELAAIDALITQRSFSMSCTGQQPLLKCDAHSEGDRDLGVKYEREKTLCQYRPTDWTCLPLLISVHGSHGARVDGVEKPDKGVQGIAALRMAVDNIGPKDVDK